jgi:hypothetical protein
MAGDKKSFTEDLVEDATANPDAPANSDETPPQTVGNEESSDWPEEKGAA